MLQEMNARAALFTEERSSAVGIQELARFMRRPRIRRWRNLI